MPVQLGDFRMLEEKVAADYEEDSDHGKLDDHDRGVEIGRFLDADHEDGRDHHDDGHRDQVENAVTCGNPTSLTPGGNDITGIH